METALTTLRIEQAEADTAGGQVRDAAHARELDINRRQQQIALDRQQATMLETRAGELDQERQQLEARREPERQALAARRQALQDAEAQRDVAAGGVQAAGDGVRAGPAASIETMEQDVERTRGDVYAVVNTLTALHHAAATAGAQRERAVESAQRFALESRELAAELEQVQVERQSSAAQLRRAQEEARGRAPRAGGARDGDGQRSNRARVASP